MVIKLIEDHKLKFDAFDIEDYGIEIDDNGEAVHAENQNNEPFHHNTTDSKNEDSFNNVKVDIILVDSFYDGNELKPDYNNHDSNKPLKEENYKVIDCHSVKSPHQNFDNVLKAPTSKFASSFRKIEALLLNKMHSLVSKIEDQELEKIILEICNRINENLEHNMKPIVIILTNLILLPDNERTMTPRPEKVIKSQNCTKAKLTVNFSSNYSRYAKLHIHAPVASNTAHNTGSFINRTSEKDIGCKKPQNAVANIDSPTLNEITSFENNVPLHILNNSLPCTFNPNTSGNNLLVTTTTIDKPSRNNKCNITTQPWCENPSPLCKTADKVDFKSTYHLSPFVTYPSAKQSQVDTSSKTTTSTTSNECNTYQASTNLLGIKEIINKYTYTNQTTHEIPGTTDVNNPWHCSNSSSTFQSLPDSTVTFQQSTVVQNQHRKKKAIRNNAVKSNATALSQPTNYNPRVHMGYFPPSRYFNRYAPHTAANTTRMKTEPVTLQLHQKDYTTPNTVVPVLHQNTGIDTSFDHQALEEHIKRMIKLKQIIEKRNCHKNVSISSEHNKYLPENSSTEDQHHRYMKNNINTYRPHPRQGTILPDKTSSSYRPYTKMYRTAMNNKPSRQNLSRNVQHPDTMTGLYVHPSQLSCQPNLDLHLSPQSISNEQSRSISLEGSTRTSVNPTINWSKPSPARTDTVLPYHLSAGRLQRGLQLPHNASYLPQNQYTQENPSRFQVTHRSYDTELSREFQEYFPPPL